MAEFRFLETPRPRAKTEQQIIGNNYRITVLTERLLRFEYTADGCFEDRATQKVLNREFPAVSYNLDSKGDGLVLTTGPLTVHYDERVFSGTGLSIRCTGIGGGALWHYGEEVRDLKGTARTLDCFDGDHDLWGHPIDLGHGIISEAGLAILDDTGSMAIEEDGRLIPRDRGHIDFYVFGYGHDYLEALHAFYQLTGKTPLLPRFVFGNWWSRYHAYTEAEYQKLITDFEDKKIPFSVAVIDMDWHLVEIDPVYGSGWTGYTWNRQLFPDPPRFLYWLHDHGLKTTLNVHPADGVRAFEERYSDIARAVGKDPALGEPVEFDLTNPDFVDAYFEKLHHPMEREGVDFWWIDWQQGTVTKIEGLDPLWMLNHYHYLDSMKQGRRPLTFSRYAGPGSHRYPIGFSGDTVTNWASLDFQPYFTANASNIGYTWWSHDIGGHMLGERDDELTARWVEYGVFSPILRLHSTNSPFHGKEPWKYNKITEEIMERYLRLRNRMVPYLYTMNRLTAKEDLPLVRPMYYHEPEERSCYAVPNCYYFGTELVVSPVTKKMDLSAQVAGAKTRIPTGTWYDAFSGRRYDGGRVMTLYRPLDSIPVLARSGAIVPMKSAVPYDAGTENPICFDIYVYPGEGAFTLAEDRGDETRDLEENWAFTKMHQADGVFQIAPALGNLSVLPEKRTWNIIFNNVQPGQMPTVMVDGKPIEALQNHDMVHRLTVTMRDVPVTEEISVIFEGGLKEATSRFREDLFLLLERAQISFEVKGRIWDIIEAEGKAALGAIMAEAENLPADLLGAIAEILTAER